MSKRGNRKPRKRNYKIRGYQVTKPNRKVKYDPNNPYHQRMLELHGEGWFEDAFNSVKNWVEDAASKIKNEFTNPDSLLNQAAKKIENELGKVFDPQKNGLKEKFEQFSRDVGPAFAALGDKLANDLDPAKNGVKAAFDKFGADVNGAFNEIGNKIREQAARDKAALDSAFASVGDALANSIGNKDWWEKTMTDPETYFFLAGALLQAAGSFLGPVGLAAANGVLGATRMIVKAAKGEQVNLSDVMDMVVSMVPGGGAAGKAAATGAKTAAKTTTAAANSASGLLEATIAKAKTSIPPPGPGRAKKLGEQLVGMTQTAENMGIVPPLVPGTTPPTASTDYKARLKEAMDKRDAAGISNDTIPAPTGSNMTAESVEQFYMDVEDRVYYESELDNYTKKAREFGIEIPADIAATKKDPTPKIMALFTYVDENLSLAERITAVKNRLAALSENEEFKDVGKKGIDEPKRPWTEEAIVKYEEAATAEEERVTNIKKAQDAEKELLEIHKVMTEEGIGIKDEYRVMDATEYEDIDKITAKVNLAKEGLETGRALKVIEKELADIQKTMADEELAYPDIQSLDWKDTLEEATAKVEKARLYLENGRKGIGIQKELLALIKQMEDEELPIDGGYYPVPGDTPDSLTTKIETVKERLDGGKNMKVIQQEILAEIEKLKTKGITPKKEYWPTSEDTEESAKNKLELVKKANGVTEERLLKEKTLKTLIGERQSTGNNVEDSFEPTDEDTDEQIDEKISKLRALITGDKEKTQGVQSLKELVDETWDLIAINDNVGTDPVMDFHLPVDGDSKEIIQGKNETMRGMLKKSPEGVAALKDYDDKKAAEAASRPPPETDPIALKDPDLAANPDKLEDLGLDTTVTEPNLTSQGQGMPRFKRRKLNRC